MNKNKLFRRILIGGMLLMAAGVIISIIHHYQLRAAVNRYRAELKAKGELVELSQAVPPPVAPDKDGTALFLQALALEQTSKTMRSTSSFNIMRMVAPGKAMACAQQPDLRDDSNTNSWTQLKPAGKDEEIQALLTQLIGRPECNFNFDYQRGFSDGSSFTNLHLAQLKVTARFLSNVGLVDLHAGDLASAVTNVRAMLVLANATQSQRLLISELVGMAIASMAQNLTWEILQSPDVTEAQLASMEVDWGRINFLQAYTQALVLEQYCSDITLAEWRKSNAAIEETFDLGSADWENQPSLLDQATLETKIFLWRYWWSYPDELRALRGYQILRQSAQEAARTGAGLQTQEKQAAALNALGIVEPPGDWMELIMKTQDFRSLMSESILSIQAAYKMVIRTEISRRIVVTAIALKRYQLQHGEWPDKLAKLVPQYLLAVPQDAMTGQPLPYHRKSDGTFLLYSAGEDGVDNGGDPTPPKEPGSTSFYWLKPKARDWVWPQPATPAEIDAFNQSEQRRRH